MPRLARLLPLALIAACATTYRPPTEAAPPAWQGAAGVELVEGSLTAEEGIYRQGDTIASWQVRARRAGVLAETVIFRGALGGEVTIPAGQPMSAQQYSLVVSSYGTTTNQNAQNDPTEWCVRDAGGQLYCAFWEAPDRARYNRFYGALVEPATSTASTNGTTGPVPIIREGETEIVGAATLRIEGFGQHGVRLVGATTDEDGERSQGYNRFLRYKDGAALFGAYGGQVRVEPAELDDRGMPRAVRVSFPQPLRPGLRASDVVAALTTAIELRLREAEEAGDEEEAERLRGMLTRLRTRAGAL